jgi:hypothetical protein
MNMRNRVSICTLIPEELTHRSDFMLPDAKRFELGVSSEELCHAIGLANKNSRLGDSATEALSA